VSDELHITRAFPPIEQFINRTDGTAVKKIASAQQIPRLMNISIDVLNFLCV
jgi:hypothetical protein